MVFGFGKKKAVTPEIYEEQSLPMAMADDDDEVITVIAAAVAYLTQGRGVLTTIRRVAAPGVPSWSLAGRQDTMNLRQI